MRRAQKQFTASSSWTLNVKIKHMPRAAAAAVAAMSTAAAQWRSWRGWSAANSNNKTRKSMRMVEFNKECASVCVCMCVCVCSTLHCERCDESCDWLTTVVAKRICTQGTQGAHCVRDASKGNFCVLVFCFLFYPYQKGRLRSTSLLICIRKFPRASVCVC